MSYNQLDHFYKKRDQKDLLLIVIQALKLDKVPVDGRLLNSADIAPQPVANGEFIFLAPDTIMEQITHDWKPFDSMAGRAGQTLSHVGNLGREAKATAGGAMPASKFRMDTPLIYDGSDRRKFQFEVQFLDQDTPGATMKCIDELRRFSCAKTGNRTAIDRIDFPYVFSVRTDPYPFMIFKQAALTSIQTSYGYPYMGGSASQVSMTLEFEDMLPLYEDSFNSGGSVTTSIQR